MDDLIEIEGGEVTASLDDRTITGLLIPYGEMGRTNVGQFQVEAGIIRIPNDPSVVGLNTDHDRFAPVGRATRLWETPAGIMASLTIANTPAGDAALADALDPNGKRRCLSGEFRTGIKAGKATGGDLSGAALVEKGAFPSAMVLASDTPDPYTAPEASSSSQYVTEFTDEDGTKWRRVEENTSTTTVTKVSDEPAADDTSTQEDTTVTASAIPVTKVSDEPAADDTSTQEDTTVTASAIPATQRAGAPTAPPAATQAREADMRAVFAAVADLKYNPHAAMNPAHPAHGVLAALADIKMTGTGALPAGGNVLRPNWLGPIYQGIPYVRQYIGLGTLGTDITAGGKAGYTLHRGTASSPVNTFDGTWAGNKSDIKSGVGFTKATASTLDRFAFGDDIGREFFDLPGGIEVVEAFFRLVAEDNLVWSDELALKVWRTVAGTPIAPKTYPGVAGHDYPDALGMVIQGILGVKAKKADNRRDVPTFIIANEAAYEELLYTPKDLIPEFVSFTASTDGTGSGDGLSLVVGDTGVEDSPSVIVGSGKAVEFDELPGGPLIIDALDIARGGVDRALHGYLQTFVVRPEAVVHIGVADTTP